MRTLVRAESTAAGTPRPARPAWWSSVVARLLVPRDSVVRCTVRGFDVRDARSRERFELIGRTVLAGCRTALIEREPAALSRTLEAQHARELLGFAFEGAGMGLCLLDRLAPWGGGRWSAFAHGPGAAHDYMLHVGAGLAHAHLRRALDLPADGYDVLHGALVADGYGFHAGYFRTRAVLSAPPRWKKVSESARSACDQGLGRSLWFACGGRATTIAAALARFEAARRPDLWSGVGLAAAYAGPGDAAQLEELVLHSGPARTHLAQGAAFAAEARERAENPAEHTDLACRVLCGSGAAQAAALVRHERARLTDARGPLGPAGYERWRLHIRAALARGPA